MKHASIYVVIGLFLFANAAAVFFPQSLILWFLAAWTGACIVFTFVYNMPATHSLRAFFRAGILAVVLGLIFGVLAIIPGAFLRDVFSRHSAGQVGAIVILNLIPISAATGAFFAAKYLGGRYGAVLGGGVAAAILIGFFVFANEPMSVLHCYVVDEPYFGAPCE